MRKVGTTADHIHREARYFKLLFAITVELLQFRDRRHLAQQPYKIETALFHRSHTPQWQRSPADLPFDAGNKFLNTLCSGLSLFLLQRKQRCLAFPVAEPKLYASIDEQCDCHQTDECHDIFAEEAAAPVTLRHSVRPWHFDLHRGSRNCVSAAHLVTLVRAQ